MGRALTLELSERVYAALQLRADETSQSPAELAAATLEQRFNIPDGVSGQDRPLTETEKQAARERFEHHLGAVNLGYATGVENDAIDAELVRIYADDHEEG